MISIKTILQSHTSYFWCPSCSILWFMCFFCIFASWSCHFLSFSILIKKMDFVYLILQKQMFSYFFSFIYLVMLFVILLLLFFQYLYKVLIEKLLRLCFILPFVITQVSKYIKNNRIWYFYHLMLLTTVVTQTEHSTVMSHNIYKSCKSCLYSMKSVKEFFILNIFPLFLIMDSA
jgi:hypothetical protein